MISFFTSRIGKVLIAFIATAGILLGAVQMGAGREREAFRTEQLEEFVETKERIDHVEASPTRGAAVERLRNNGWVR